jgi:chromosome segregation ATPase
VSSSEVVKRTFIELLEKDVEFRYAVAGYLGLSEILRSIEKLWEEVRSLREEVRKLWENQNKLWENQNRLWEEVRSLREETKKLWEGQNKLWEEVKTLREGQNKLWENQNRLWEEVKALREGQNKLWEEVRGLREDFRRLERRVSRLERGMSSLAMTVGVTLDYYTAAFIEELLRDLGIPEEKIRIKVNIVLRNPEGVEREVDIFNRDPLIVGEVTTYIGSVEGVKEEVGKVLEDVRFVESMFGSKVYMAVLAVENVSEDVVKYLEDECRRYNIRLVYGREIPRLDRLD